MSESLAQDTNKSKETGFFKNKNIKGYLSVVIAGQIIYSAFEAFKGTFYTPLMEVLNLNNAQLGIIFSLIGISVFFYIPGGWINNRFSVKSILITGLLIRMFTMFIIVFFNPGFGVLQIIAVIWGLTDAVFWPAVLNGVTLLSDKSNRGMAFGLLESIRRAIELSMNLLLVGAMALFGGITIFKTGMLAYNLLIIPVVWLIVKYVPSNGIAAEESDASERKRSGDALTGLLKVLVMPKVWLASITAMTVYWSYINLIYTVPYLQSVYHISQTQASIFGILNTGAMGVLAGIIAGFLSDKIFKSPSKLMFVALLLTSIPLLLIVILPKTSNMLLPSIILLLFFSFAIFLAKSIILAPIAESEIPEKYSGASMSVGSFAAYAPVFWAYGMNGTILDTSATPAEGYQKIFLIGVFVALFGIASAFLLMIVNRKSNKTTNADAE